MIAIRWTSFVLLALTAVVMFETPQGWGLFWLAVLFAVFFSVHLLTYGGVQDSDGRTPRWPGGGRRG